MLLMMDSKEGRDVATDDIVGAHLLAEMKSKVIVKLTGMSVDILCKANKEYSKYVVMKREES